MLTPQQIAAKWAQRTQQATQAYIAGIQATTVNPMAMAAAAAPKYLQGVQDAVNSGRWQKGLARNPASYWQSQAVNKGANRLGTGASNAQPKMEAFLTKFLPVLQQNVAQVKAMPNNTFDDRMARMVQMATLNHQFKQ